MPSIKLNKARSYCIAKTGESFVAGKTYTLPKKRTDELLKLKAGDNFIFVAADDENEKEPASEAKREGGKKSSDAGAVDV